MVQGDSRLMEILALKVLITDQSANRLAAEAMPRDLGLRDLRVRFAPEGAYVSGAYQMLVSVPFETLWELSVQGGRIAARLAGVNQTGGAAASMIRLPTWHCTSVRLVRDGMPRLART